MHASRTVSSVDDASHHETAPSASGDDNYSPVRVPRVQAGIHTYMDLFAGTIYPHRYVVTVSDPKRPYCTGACLSDELSWAGRIRAVSRLPMTPGGRFLVLRTQYNSVGHRARLSGVNRHERERLTTYARVIVMTLVRGDIARGKPFSGDQVTFPDSACSKYNGTEYFRVSQNVSQIITTVSLKVLYDVIGVHRSL